QIVINNRSLVMIEKWQNENFNGRIFESKTPEVNYKKIAEAMGANGFDAFSVQELFSLLEKAKKIKTPTVINWRTDL
ncbi:MAG: thiamine pyrophosphate-dependent enzyme, partial [Clostridia bacterium]